MLFSTKVKRHELVDDYQTQIHNNAFGYKTVEFESIDIKSGYTIFLFNSQLSNFNVEWRYKIVAL
jgi:hypothetical protein